MGPKQPGPTVLVRVNGETYDEILFVGYTVVIQTSVSLSSEFKNLTILGPFSAERNVKEVDFCQKPIHPLSTANELSVFITEYE